LEQIHFSDFDFFAFFHPNEISVFLDIPAPRKKTFHCFVVGSTNCHSESENFLKFLLTRANFSKLAQGYSIGLNIQIMAWLAFFGITKA